MPGCPPEGWEAESSLHWFHPHWLSVAPGVANFLALSSCARAWAEQAFHGFWDVKGHPAKEAV